MLRSHCTAALALPILLLTASVALGQIPATGPSGSVPSPNSQPALPLPSQLANPQFSTIVQGISPLLSESDRALPDIDNDGLPGTLMICGGGRTLDSFRERLVATGGGNKCRLVVIPTASATEVTEDDRTAILNTWKPFGPQSITILHTRNRADSDTDTFVAPLRQATAVWIPGGWQTLIGRTYAHTQVERELHALLRRNGVIGGTSAGAACMARVMIVRGEVFPVPGLGLIPGTLVDQHFVARERRARLIANLNEFPGYVGLGVDEHTAAIVRGRRIECFGDSTVHLYLAANSDRTLSETILKSGESADFTAYRRAALARSQRRYPRAEPALPGLPKGSLVLCGDGAVPGAVAQRFRELAGAGSGPQASRILVVPAADDDDDGLDEATALRRAGAGRVDLLAGLANKSTIEQLVGGLESASGLWITGNRQTTLLEQLDQPTVRTAFQRLLERNGVIGGDTAGAVIQGEGVPGDGLTQSSPNAGPRDRFATPDAEGYETGFRLLPGVAIGANSTRKEPWRALLRFQEKHPKWLAIGVDDGTALIIQGHVAEVCGERQVHFFDASHLPTHSAAAQVNLSTGEKYDLVKRQRLPR